MVFFGRITSQFCLEGVANRLQNRMERCSLADGRRRRVCWLAGALAGGVISTRGVGRSTRIQWIWDWLDRAGRKDMTLKLCLGAKLSCRLGEEPYPREPDGLMPGRRTAGSREAGGGADCHADFGERIRSGWRKAREPRIARRWAGRAGPRTRTGFACTSSAERYVGKAATAGRWLLSTQIG
jgi:hypothetical protein